MSNATASTAPAGRPSGQLRSPIGVRHLVRRLLTGLIAVWGAITIVFFALYSSNNPVLLLVPPDAPPEETARLTRLYGFDQPVPVQYVKFLGNVVTGSFPDSLRYGQDPLTIALQKVPASLLLGAASLVLGVLVGGLIGYVAATARYAWLRRVPLSIATVADAVPTFFVGMVLILVFAVTLRWVPTMGRGAGGVTGMILPTITLAIAFVPAISRVFRTALLEALRADHVRTAIAKGVSRPMVALRHVVANAVGPTLNVVGIQAGVLLGGAVVTESVFGWPGIGQLSINAVQNRDYPLVIVCVLIIAIGFVLINLVVDVLSVLIEPRLRA
ncbi:ABC transporter permease [Nakamurella leprariae]|uniref:ABC transporter permease n=1 Tax=Nakamurella leprariae TaxID=2803911 RepID=A0A938Y829_9ACTN|nr:ABC transporter permease [Nakamurella leprariae]MBM9465677.1 ABC transporter permease [Nakamurella leprariae]